MLMKAGTKAVKTGLERGKATFQRHFWEGNGKIGCGWGLRSQQRFLVWETRLTVAVPSLPIFLSLSLCPFCPPIFFMMLHLCVSHSLVWSASVYIQAPLPFLCRSASSSLIWGHECHFHTITVWVQWVHITQEASRAPGRNHQDREKHGVAALREETGQPPWDSAWRAAWKGADKGIFFSSWVLVSECFQCEDFSLLYAEENSNFWVSYF